MKPGKERRMGSIKWKMATLYMILVVTVMTGCGAFILYNLRNNAYENAFQELEYTAERIVDVLSIEDLPMGQKPEDVFGEILTSVMLESVNVESDDMGSKTICLLDETGRLLYSRQRDITAQELASRAVMDACEGKKMDSLYVHTDYANQQQVGEYALSFSLPQNGKTYILLIRQPMDSVQRSLRSATSTIFVSMLMGIVVAGVLGYFLAVNVTSPILRLTKKTQQLASGHLMAQESETARQPGLPAAEKTKESRGDELTRLEMNFDHMAHELSNMILELQQMEQMQKEFVADVSHELRTPITTVKSYVETLLDDADADPALRARFLGVISQESDRMAALIADLLELSKMDSHQVQLVREPVELGQLLCENIRRLQWEAGSRQQILAWAPDMDDGIREVDTGDFPALPDEYWVTGESRKIEQVLRNLLTNAMKYSPEGARIEAGLYRKPGEIRVMIRDNGMGISREDQKRIFDRFYRVDKARSRSMGGTGLGLAIAKEIMDLHGGQIWVVSQLGQGSEFWLAFPEGDN